MKFKPKARIYELFFHQSIADVDEQVDDEKRQKYRHKRYDKRDDSYKKAISNAKSTHLDSHADRADKGYHEAHDDEHIEDDSSYAQNQVFQIFHLASFL